MGAGIPPSVFHEPSPAPFLRSKKGTEIGGMIVCFAGFARVNTMAHTLGNVYLSNTNKRAYLNVYVLPKTKKSRFPEKFSEKRLELAAG